MAHDKVVYKINSEPDCNEKTSKDYSKDSEDDAFAVLYEIGNVETDGKVKGIKSEECNFYRNRKKR